MYDHIYWMLTADGTTHVTPPALVPEMAKYTIFVDGISKAFAATGVRVGWAVGPQDVIDFTREHLAGYEAPRGVVIVDEVKRAPNGKADYKWAKQTAIEALRA